MKRLIALLALAVPLHAAPAISSLTCASGSITGPAMIPCTVTLNAPAVSGGFLVFVTSNNAAVSVPQTVTVLSGTTSTAFNATVKSVTTPVIVTLSSYTNGVSKSFVMTVGASGPVPPPTVRPVQLSWSITNPSDPAVSYNVSRSSNGGTSYTQLNAAPLTVSTYSDATIVSGTTYLYRVAGLDAKGVQVATTNPVTMTIP